MSDGLTDWALAIQLHALIKQEIQQRNPKEDCQTCMKLVDEAISNPLEKRVVFNVCMELLQNVSHHAERLANTTLLGTFFFHQDAKSWYILTKNSVKQTAVESLKTKLERLNRLCNNSLALKKLYREIIQSDAPIGKHAGLGLLDMVRKSKHALQYKFDQQMNDNADFTVMVVIDKK